MPQLVAHPDGHEALLPFAPTAADPWNREKAAHLLRRAGFGGPPAEVERLVDLGFERAVDALVDFDDDDADLDRLIHETGGALGDMDDPERPGQPLIDNVRLWWIFRMVHTRSPLREKLALLWHDHFACQESEDLRATLVLEQNRMFRRLAAGSFRELLHAVARDPAMLLFLDNRNSTRGHPNENWARELLELFTLGLDRYSQRDVVEIARCFTGWTTPMESSLEFQFVPDRHDPGDKTVLGVAIQGRAGADGIEEGDEVIDIVLARDECAPFVARKIARWFHDDEPDEALVAELGAVLRREWSIRETVRVLLRSRAFWDPARRFTHWRTPVDLVASVARSLGVQNVHVLRPDKAVRAMGMHVFKPPSVAGWDLGRAWVNAGAFLARRDFAEQVARAAHTTRRVTGTAAFDVDALVRGVDPDAGAIVDAVQERLLVQPLAASRALALALSLREEPDARARARAALRAIVGAGEMVLA